MLYISLIQRSRQTRDNKIPKNKDPPEKDIDRFSLSTLRQWFRR